jgi:hypothetical protein
MIPASAGKRQLVAVRPLGGLLSGPLELRLLEFRVNFAINDDEIAAVGQLRHRALRS